MNVISRFVKNLSLIVAIILIFTIMSHSAIPANGDCIPSPTCNDIGMRDDNSTINFSAGWDILVERDNESPYYGLKHLAVKAGQISKINFLITNKGGMDDTYDLILTKDPPAGWEVRFSDTLNDTSILNIAGSTASEGVTGIIGMEFIVPSDAIVGIVTPITVKVTSHSYKYMEEDMSQDETLYVEVLDSSYLIMSTDDPTRVIRPGQSIELDLFVTNQGTKPISVKFELESEVSDGWEINFNSKSNDIFPNCTIIIEVEVKSPVTAMAGSSLGFTILGTVINDPYTDARVSMLAQVCNIPPDFMCDIPESEIDQEGIGGEWLYYHISLQNYGDDEEDFHLHPLNVELGWNIYLSSMNDVLQPGGEVEFNVSVHIPESATVGTYPIGLNLSNSREYIHIFVKATVKQFYDIRLNILCHDIYNSLNDTSSYTITPPAIWGEFYEQFVSPSTSRSTILRLINNGNGPDRVRLTLNKKDGDRNYNGWDYYFDGVSNSHLMFNGNDTENVDFAVGTQNNYRPIPTHVKELTTPDDSQLLLDSSGLYPRTIDILINTNQVVFIRLIINSPSIKEETFYSDLEYVNSYESFRLNFYSEAESNGSLNKYFVDQTGLNVVDIVNISLYVNTIELNSNGITDPNSTYSDDDNQTKMQEKNTKLDKWFLLIVGLVLITVFIGMVFLCHKKKRIGKQDTQ